MIEVKEALEKVIQTALKPKIETINLERSYSYILAKDIVAGEDIPPFDNSAMDGYAVKSADSSSGKTLKIIEELPAGKVAVKSINKGEAVLIMTGAPIPKGADSVIEVESTSREGNLVKLRKAVKRGENIRLTGEDISKGSVVLNKGNKINAVSLGICASLGYESIAVYKKPTVSILSTGSEVVPPGIKLTKGKIRDANSYSLEGQCLELGIKPALLGIAKDSRQDTEKKLREALKSDVVLTTGGVSVGEYDFVREVLEDIGARRMFWSVAQKPGKPMALYVMWNSSSRKRNGSKKEESKKAIFALPGNPVASMVCFEVYVRPFLLKSMGAKNIFRDVIKVKVGSDIKKKKGRANWIRVSFKEENGYLLAFPKGRQGSGILTSMIAEGLLYLDEQSEGIEKMEEAEALLLN